MLSAQPARDVIAPGSKRVEFPTGIDKDASEIIGAKTWRKQAISRQEIVIGQYDVSRVTH